MADPRIISPGVLHLAALTDEEHQLLLLCPACKHPAMDHAAIKCRHPCDCTLTRTRAIAARTEMLLAERLQDQKDAHRKALGAAWSQVLDLMMEVKIDGVDLLTLVFWYDPSLRKAFQEALSGRKCWCGDKVGPREPGDERGLGCLGDINHDWRWPDA